MGEGREQWDYQLNEPLPGREKKASPAQIEDEGQAFMDFMQGQMPGMRTGA